MESVVHIWNMALGFVGTRTVASQEENTQEAQQCRLYWDNARRQVLRDFPWNVSRRRAWLAAVPVPEGWEQEYAFALPKDCVKVLAVYGQNTGRNTVPYTLAYDAAQMQQVLLCPVQRALLLYSADVTHVELFDDIFIHLVARRLAALIAVPLLRNNSSKVQELEQLYRAAIPQAQSANASETPCVRMRDVWLDARS